MPPFLARLLFFPTLLWNVFLGRFLRLRPWWHQIDERVFLGALPFPCDLPKLRALGIRAVVNTCLEYRGPEEQYRKAGIRHLRLPTVDFTPLSLTDITRGVAFIEEETGQGRAVYIHCKAGRGRSALLALCWLAAHHGWSAAQAQAHLLSRRPHIKKGLDRLAVVREFMARDPKNG
jgi:atypical dual specificity phosphatase